MPRERAKERTCDLAIKQTLGYSSVFNYPMSFFQLVNYLVSDESFDNKFFKQSLRRLIKNKQIKVKDEKFYLSGTKPLSWEVRQKNSLDLINKNKECLTILSRIPWIKLIGITGSVAALNAEKEDDLDIFVVTAKNRVWLTRGFVILILIALKKYPNRESTNLKVCPNIFVDEDHISWPTEKRNIYTAHEVAMLQPYFDKDSAYFRFLNENIWVSDYLPNFTFSLPKRIRNTFQPKSFVVNLIEELAMKMEMTYMKPRKTTEITTKGIIHFNKRDSTNMVISKFKQIASKM